MDKFDFLNLEGKSADSGETEVKVNTSLEFEISEQAPVDSAEISATVPESVEVPSATVDVFDVALAEDSADEATSSSSFVDTSLNIRPTYLPRFTEVSDTYRMQNDPRPRPKTDTHSVKVERAEEASDDLDPTTEKLEECEVEKVVVTANSLRDPEPVDERLTVLKFSTPSLPDENDAEKFFEAVKEAETTTRDEEAIDEIPVTLPEEEEIIGEASEDSENKTIPDPEATFSVVDFTPREMTEVVEPLGASDSDKKDKNVSSSEFNSPMQRDSIKDRFLDTLMSVKVRLFGALILLLAVITIDCCEFFGVNVFASFGLANVPSAKAIIDMQFSICVFLLALPETLRAFKLLSKKKFAPELVNVLSLAVIVLNDAVIAAKGATDYLTFGVLYGLQCFATIIAAYYRADSEFTSFKLVSRNVAKNVLDKRLTRELQRENLALDGAVDEYNSKTARMFRTVFVSNFFKRSSVSCENSANVATMISISTGVALVMGMVSFFIDGYSPVSGVQSAAMVFMLSYPIFSLLSHKIPLRHAFARAAAEESAFVGESSVYEGADVDVFTYEDTEIFGIEDVSIRKVHLYGKAYNTPKAMKQMYALFSVVGGPLDFVFSSALDRKCSPARDIVIEDNGVMGVMDGHRICAGTKDYMISHGVKIPDDDYMTTPSATDSTKVMYGAEDGEVYVKFFIRYSFSEEFTMLLPDLKAKKIVPLIYTRDPNITTDLLKVLTLGEDIIRVMKKYVPRTSEEKTYRRIDSGIVTHGDKSNAINMVLLAKKYAAFQESLAASELISMIVGAVLAVVLVIGDMFVLPATMLALWQMVWCAVLYVRSKLSFRNTQEKEELAEEQ